MVEIKALSERSNVHLGLGASQHWTDLGTRTDARLINRVALPQVSGRTLVVGPVSKAMRTAVAQAADEALFLVRGIPDADELARSLPGHEVWAADVAALVGRGERYDTILVLTDISYAVSLELESTRTWAGVVAQLDSLLAPEGTLVLGIENDLGVHRIGGKFNPRSRDLDGDWDLTVTWDRSRPRSVAQVCEFAGEHAAVFAVWPSLTEPTALIGTGVPAGQAEAFALHSGLISAAGLDPAYLVDAAAGAGRVNDFAAAWLLVRNPRVSVPAVLADPEQILEWRQAPAAPGRSVLSLWRDRAAASDLPGMRRLVETWSAAHDGGRFDASLALSMIDDNGVVHPLRELDEPADGRWAALAQVAAAARDRAWRTPWPVTDDAPSWLRQLGAMAGLPEISHDEAMRMLPPAMAVRADAEPQELAAAVARNNAELDAMRSKLRWVEMQLEQANQRLAAGTPKGVAESAARKVRKLAKDTGTKVLKEFGLR